MPVTVAFIYFFGASTYLLINCLKGKLKRNYVVVIIICLLIYTGADLKGLGRNKCDRHALERMTNSQDTIITIPKDCFVMNWDNIFDPRKSEQQAELIYLWYITPEKKLYYNEK